MAKSYMIPDGPVGEPPSLLFCRTTKVPLACYETFGIVLIQTTEDLAQDMHRLPDDWGRDQ